MADAGCSSILVIQKQESRHSLAPALAALGHSILGPVLKGEEALIQVRQRPPDLVVAEASLDGTWDGLTTAARIQEEWDGPVVLVAGRNDGPRLVRDPPRPDVEVLWAPFPDWALDLTVKRALGPVTVRRRERARLKKNEYQFRRMIEAVNEGVWTMNGALETTFVNRVMAEMLDYGPGEMLGRPVTDFMFESELAHHQALMERRKAGHSDRYERKFKSRTGHPVWVRVSATPYFSDDGRFSGAVAMVSEITEQKEARDRARESEFRYRQLFQHMGNGVAVYRAEEGGRDFILVDMNRAGERINRVRHEEIVGRRVTEVFPGVGDFGLLAVLKRVWRTGVTEVFPISRYADHRLNLWVENTVVKLASGLVAAIHEDTTDKHAIEDALRESEARFRSIVENAPLLITVLREGRCLYLNPAGADLLGIHPATPLASKSFFDFLVPEDRSRARARIGDPEEDPGGVDLELRFLGRDSGRLDIEARCVPITYRGLGADMLIAWDVTERKKAEAGLQAALEDKEILFKELHHRVKNNMQVISSLLNLQAGKVEDPEVLDALLESRNRISTMALLHESLYQGDSLGTVDLEPYVDSLVENLDVAFARKCGQVHMVSRIDPGLTLGLDQAVPCGLALNELISNAYKHAFPGDRCGEITVLGEERRSGEIVMTVQDNGVGLPPGMDWRLHGTLGFSLVLGLVEGQLKGKVRVIQNRGLQCRISFPCPEQARRTRPGHGLK